MWARFRVALSCAPVNYRCLLGDVPKPCGLVLGLIYVVNGSVVGHGKSKMLCEGIRNNIHNIIRTMQQPHPQLQQMDDRRTGKKTRSPIVSYKLDSEFPPHF